MKLLTGNGALIWLVYLFQTCLRHGAVTGMADSQKNAALSPVDDLIHSLEQRLLQDNCTLPCQHGSLCVASAPNFTGHPVDPVDGSPLDFHVPEGNYHCACPHGWTGILCDVKFITCDGLIQPCYNGGKCIPGLQDNYTNDQLFCDCTNASDANGNRYVGKYCEALADDSNVNATQCGDSDQVCLNGGECNPSYPNFGEPCLCQPGISGQYCEYKDETVPNCTLPCMHGGYCVLGKNPDPEAVNYWTMDPDDPAQQYCECPDHWGGPYCGIAKEPCTDDGTLSCYNGGTCVAHDTGGHITHLCNCTTGYTETEAFAGRYCQFPATSFCSPNETIGRVFCTNNGTCLDNPYDACQCPKGFVGFSCEYETIQEDGDQEGEGDGTGEEPQYGACTLVCNNDGRCRYGLKESGQDYGITDYVPSLNATDEDYMYCECPDGFTGVYCEVAVEMCGDGEKVCLHGSDCYKDNTGEHKCDCSTVEVQSEYGYVGDHCEHKVHDICNINGAGIGVDLYFCVNGGTCKKMVSSGEGHPGCNCQEGFTGPHCELRSDARETSPPPSTNESNLSSGRSGLKIFALIVALISMAVLSFLAVVKYQRSRKHRKARVTDGLKWPHYQDSPRPPTINLAPRNRSVTTDMVEPYAANDHASSRDPFVTHLAPKPEFLESLFESEKKEDEPQIFIGPPRDEDGHVLHSVDII